MPSSKLATVRALLDKADSTEFEAEAKSLRAKAEELMVRYRIDQEELLERREVTAEVVTPVHFDIDICLRGQYSPHYNYIFGDVARHVGLRHMIEWDVRADGIHLIARGVGFELDIEYAELLYTSARMAFRQRLEPEVNPELSDQVNVYNLRSAGIERVRIADIMWGSTDKVFLSRVGRLYKAECANRGEDAALSGRGVTGAAYRQQYADAFVFKLSERLRMARAGEGTGLVLGNREHLLNEAFYTRFPGMRPKAAVAGGTTNARGECAKCAKAKSGACREHPVGRSSRGGPNYFSTAAVRGRAAGQAAARSVDLGRGGGGRQLGGA